MPSFRYRGGIPFVEVKLGVPGQPVKPDTLTFIVDSGAKLSLAPSHYARPFQLGTLAEVDTGLKDASGQPIMAAAVKLEVHIKGLDPVIETIHFGAKMNWGLLGQCSFFSQLEIKFANFALAKKGPLFAMYPPKRRLVAR